MRREDPSEFPFNEKIRVPEVRVITEEGEFVGIMPTAQAIALAMEQEKDLVLVSPQAQPPVAKILNYGKFQYQREKMLKKQRSQNKGGDTKTIKLSARIGQHDQDIRANQTVKFLKNGDKVRIEVILRGREKQHPELGMDMLQEFLKAVSALAPYKLEQTPKRMGGTFSAIITP